ncbi:MAG: hypothetical protein AAE985_00600 [Thermoplasmataceae archaeon]|nr:hypothetical protein [Candidatus Thermoplasmatota archaeon]
MGKHLVCPYCKSDNVIGSLLMVYGTYRCLDCGYQGSFIIEMDDRNYEKFLMEKDDDPTEK